MSGPNTWSLFRLAVDSYCFKASNEMEAYTFPISLLTHSIICLHSAIWSLSPSSGLLLLYMYVVTMKFYFPWMKQNVSFLCPCYICTPAWRKIALYAELSILWISANPSVSDSYFPIFLCAITYFKIAVNVSLTTSLKRSSLDIKNFLSSHKCSLIVLLSF